MDRAYPALRQMFTDIRNLWFDKIGLELRNFSIELSKFLYGLNNHPTHQWRQRFHVFAAGQRFQGRYMTPDSERALLAYIDHWAAMLGADSAEEQPGVPLDSTWPELSEEARTRVRGRLGLPDFYAKPFEWGDGEWEDKLEELARIARDKMLATCRALQTLGSLARNVDQLPDDGIDVLASHVDRVHAAHDEYVQALIDIERTWLSYIKAHWYIGWQVEQLVLKIAGDLPPRLFDLPSAKLQTLARARAEVGNALAKTASRVATTYKVAYWTDIALTVLEFVTGVVGVAKAVAKKEIAKGIAKAVATRMAIKAGVKQAAIQGAVLVASTYGLPPLIRTAGLNPDFVFAGVMVLQSLSVAHGLRSLRNGKGLDAPEVKTRPEADRSPDVEPKSPARSRTDADLRDSQYLEPIGPGIGRSNYRTLDEFRDAVFDQYQRFYNDAHAIVSRQVALGLVKNNRTVIGSEIDKIVRYNLRDWLVNAEGLMEGPTGMISVNRRLYDPSGTGKYRQPDIYIPAARLILDGSIQLKTIGMSQSIDFHNFSGGGNVIIVRPSAEGGSYGFFFQ